jgi:predicted transcriptional regulator
VFFVPVRPQIYTAQQSQGNTQRQLVNDLVNRAFGGSPGNLILQALSSRKSSAAEREKIRQFLDQLESAEANEDTHRSGGES